MAVVMPIHLLIVVLNPFHLQIQNKTVLILSDSHRLKIAALSFGLEWNTVYWGSTSKPACCRALVSIRYNLTAISIKLKRDNKVDAGVKL